MGLSFHNNLSNIVVARKNDKKGLFKEGHLLKNSVTLIQMLISLLLIHIITIFFHHWKPPTLTLLEKISNIVVARIRANGGHPIYVFAKHIKKYISPVLQANHDFLSRSESSGEVLPRKNANHGRS